MSPRSPRPSRKPRQTKSCTRCRKRKIRCDFQQPACGACAAAEAACLDFDAVEGIDRPRGGIAHLEQEVAELEAELLRRRSQSLSVSNVANTIASHLASDVAAAIVMPSSKPERLPSLSSAFFLSDSPVPYTMVDVGESTREAEVEENHAKPAALALIPRQVVDALLKNYCQNYRHHYPSVEEPDLQQSCQRVYEQAQPSDYDIFSVHMALAISMQTLMNFDEKKATTATYGCWAVAKSHLPQVGTTSSWERLQALQLLTHYAFLNPKHVDCSKTSAAGMRLCLQLGLHHELPASEQAKLSNDTLNTRRRLFWNSYSLDAAVHSALCQPYMWPRSTFTTQFPDVDWHVSPAPHFWLLREIESEITVAMYYPSLGLEDMLWNASFDQWFVRTAKRLDEWYQTTRENVCIGEKLEYHEMHYYAQVLRLNRSSPRCPRPTGEMQMQASRACVTLIRGFGVFEHTGRLYVLWYAQHYLYDAGLCLLALVLGELEAVNVNRQQHSGMNTLGESIATLLSCIKTCSDLLRKIARRWPRVLGHARAFEDISKAVLDELELWSTEGRTRQGHELDEVKQRLNLLSQFPPLPPSPSEPLRPSVQTVLDEAPNMNVEHFPGGVTFSEPLQTENMPTSQQTQDRRHQAPVVMEPYPDPFLTDGDEAAIEWDFAGLGGDEIFAALLLDTGGHVDHDGSRSLMLNNESSDEAVHT